MSGSSIIHDVNQSHIIVPLCDLSCSFSDGTLEKLWRGGRSTKIKIHAREICAKKKIYRASNPEKEYYVVVVVVVVVFFFFSKRKIPRDFAKNYILYGKFEQIEKFMQLENSPPPPLPITFLMVCTNRK